jgi:hypothetical protein
MEIQAKIRNRNGKTKRFAKPSWPEVQDDLIYGYALSALILLTILERCL